jgi:hypothetical protein
MGCKEANMIVQLLAKTEHLLYDSAEILRN